MRTLVLAISIIFAIELPVEAASRRLPPIDQCGGDASFTRFRAALKQANARKDRMALMGLVAPDIRTTNGGRGAKAFAESWDNASEDNWDRLKDILRLGCARSGNARVMPSFPVQFTRFAGEPDFRRLELARPGATLLKDPENEKSAIATLSWDVVTAVSSAGDRWTEVRLADGREGWISDADIYHPADVHLVVRKRRGTWMITEYVYGPWAAEEPAESGPPEIDADIKRLREEDAAAYDAGEYARAASASAQVLELIAKRSGEISAEYAQALEDHAINLSYLERSVEAEPLHRRALAWRTEMLGEKHPDTLTSLHNLASTLNALDRSAEAEPLIRQALTLRTEVLGEKYTDTLDSLHELAFALGRLGRETEAEPLNRRAFDLRTEVLGEKHPDTLASLHELAIALDRLGRETEAEPLNRRAFNLRTEVLGEKHRDTLDSLHNLGSILIDLGRSGEAEPLMRLVLSSSAEVIGEKHPDTLASLHKLADSLHALGRAAEAEPLRRRALTLRTEVLGINHPDTLASLHALALTLLQLGRAAEAEPVNRAPPPQKP